ncbi:uncharacterized protein B0T15DRAFT_499619 [Chaetomium strumarium]|uniref:Uncharacterized protein n=1 Tax=Chaetomium strumarium TaxID=1170767 RepID=A0AAJ0M7A5_9PEZI|nr:hypothetical protein B0T15DRAFT_499619 [Chaetomium strumarium]
MDGVQKPEVPGPQEIATHPSGWHPQPPNHVGCRDSRPLWTDYWQRFNTITIPLLDEDAFFSDPLAAAKVARNREHLELLEEKSKERGAELEKVLDEIPYAVIYDKNPSSPKPAWDAVRKVGRSGSLDSFIRLASGIEMPHLYSPYPTVSDDWDLLDHGVTEESASPGRPQLPPPSPQPTCGTTARIKDGKTSNGVAQGAPEVSPKSPTASFKTEPVASPAPLSSANDSPTDPALPPSPSDAGPSLTESQATPTTPPPEPPSPREADIQPLLAITSSSPRQDGRQKPVADTCWDSPGGGSKPRGKRRLHELEEPDLEEAACGKRAKREVG